MLLVSDIIVISSFMSHIGGRLCYFTLRNGVEVLQRQAGDFTKHSCDVLHAVTRLISGTRYSLFVVDRANGLGETGIIEADLELVKSILAVMEHEEAADSSIASPVVIPYSDITTGELVGSGNSKVVYSGSWAVPGGQHGDSVCITTTTTQQRTHADFTPELDILRTISTHPNLVRFYGYSQHLSKCYLVGERAPFGTLRDHLHNARRVIAVP